MRKIIQRIISAIKKEPYELPVDLSMRELFLITSDRGIQMIRGNFLKMRIHGKGIVFCGKRVRVKFGWKIRSQTGLIIGDDVYIDALCHEGVSLGRNVTIGRGTVIECTGVIRNPGDFFCAGNRVAIGAFNYIGVRGRVVIEDDTILGPYVSFHAENHIYHDVEKAIRLQGETRKGIHVERDCWIGAKATILDGVTIGRGSAVAAGAVVTKDVCPFTIVGGVPAREIGKRQSI